MSLTPSHSTAEAPTAPANIDVGRAQRARHAAQISLAQWFNSIPFVPPHALEKHVPASLQQQIVRFMAAHQLSPANMSLDMILALWRIVLHVFFRRIEVRGVHRIPPVAPAPGEGDGVLFVCAPHANQFLDPAVVSSQLAGASGRHVTFVTAEKSWKRPLVGAFARAMQGIPVARAFDNAKPGKGTIRVYSSDSTLVVGQGTEFTKQMEARGQFMLPKPLGSGTAAVVQVLSDTEVRIKSPFPTNDRIETQALTDALAKGTDFTAVPYLDQSTMYQQVYERLLLSESVGIFPEGGSHDRTTLLPLKAGAALITLGALATHPNLKLKVVPVGLYYFHRDQFRSRAVVEFGRPIPVPPELVERFACGGKDKRAATGDMMARIEEGVKSVVIEAPDLATLSFVHAARRLYPLPLVRSPEVYGTETTPATLKEQEEHRRHLTPGQVVALSRKLLKGYLQFRDEPDVMDLQRGVEEYNNVLRSFGMQDHQVANAAKQGRMHSRVWILGVLFARLVRLAGWLSVALPGISLNMPIYLISERLARIKAKEALAESTVKVQARDVMASWKVMIAAVVSPALWSLYSLVFTSAAQRALARPTEPRWWMLGSTWWSRLRHAAYATVPVIGTVPVLPFAVWPALALWAYISLRLGENALDVYRSLPPLFVALGLPPPTQPRRLLRALCNPWRVRPLTFEQVQAQREKLAAQVKEMVDKYAARLPAPDAEPATAPGLTPPASPVSPVSPPMHDEPARAASPEHSESSQATRAGLDRAAADAPDGRGAA